MLRPSCSTSGGQSFRCAGAALRVDLVWEAQDAKEVQDRQLGRRTQSVLYQR